jgi:hypothetical protein
MGDGPIPLSLSRPPHMVWHADGKLPSPPSKTAAVRWTARLPVMEPEPDSMTSRTSKRPEIAEAAVHPTCAVCTGFVSRETEIVRKAINSGNRTNRGTVVVPSRK